MLKRFCSIVNESTVGRKVAAGLNDAKLSFWLEGLVEVEEKDDDDVDDDDEDDEDGDDE
jgi:hypothetical protein